MTKNIESNKRWADLVVRSSDDAYKEGHSNGLMWGSFLVGIAGLLFTYAITGLKGNVFAGYFIFGMFIFLGGLGIFLQHPMIASIRNKGKL